MKVLVTGGAGYIGSIVTERFLHWLDRVHDMRYAALRYFNAAGASEERGEDHHPEYHLIPIVLQVALGQREQVTIFGDDYETPDGTCVRDYIHVSDLAQAHILALHALDQGSRVYNLGNGQGFSVQQVIDTAREVTGHPIPARSGPRRRPGDLGRRQPADPRRTGLAAAVPRLARHRGQRLELAPPPSAGV